jgi:AcrR family transcriptional regulator
MRDAIVETTAVLIAEHGLRAVTMSQIAEETGIGRATLYKYFPDIETILVAWHETHVGCYLDHLAELRTRAGNAAEGLEAVLEGYALISHQRARQQHGQDLLSVLHRSPRVAAVQRQVNCLIQDLLSEAAQAGYVRDDVPPDELVSYCVSALAAAPSLPSEAAVRRLVSVILAGLRPATDNRSSCLPGLASSRRGPM